MKFAFFLNKKAGKGKAFAVYQKLKTKIDSLEDSKVFITQSPEEVKNICSDLKKMDCKVIVLGGDGTVNSVVNGLGINSNSSLAVIPIGSGNDFAKEYAWYHDRDYDNTLEKIVSSNFRRFSDIGKIDYDSLESKANTHLFISSCGVGFDALVSDISRQTKFLRGLPLYLVSVIKAFTKYEEVLINSSSFEEIVGSKLMVSVGNTKYAGGGFMLNPTGQIDDGKLNACIPIFMNRRKILTVLPKAIDGTHTNLDEVKNLTFEQIKFALSSPQYLHADGEVLTRTVTSVTVSCINSAIAIVS